jgi:hypothetical protein
MTSLKPISRGLLEAAHLWAIDDTAAEEGQCADESSAVICATTLDHEHTSATLFQDLSDPAGVSCRCSKPACVCLSYSVAAVSHAVLPFWTRIGVRMHVDARKCSGATKDLTFEGQPSREAKQQLLTILFRRVHLMLSCCSD